MATITEIKQQAESIKNATQVGENTAERVGGVLSGIADKVKEQSESKGIAYDNKASGMTAVNAQAAVDEVYSALKKCPIVPHTFINAKGVVSSTTTSFSTSDFLEVQETHFYNLKPCNPGLLTIAFYDAKFNFISGVLAESTSNVQSYDLAKENIPESAVYMRANLEGKESYEGYCYIGKQSYRKEIAENTQKVNLLEETADIVYDDGKLFSYENVIKMNHGRLKTIIENASNGKCTVIYDKNGYPSLMYRIPLISVGSLEQKLGDDDTPHPAFVVGGETKKHIFCGVFLNSIYKDVPVSWFNLPKMRSKSISKTMELCKAKGDGWHMETIWERSLISLLSMRIQGNSKPHGNNNRGRNYENVFEVVENWYDTSTLPGKFANGDPWVDGTQPKTWSHNLDNFGIYDIVGGYHEFCDLIKLDKGKIYICSKNDFGSEESTWLDTGCYIGYKDGVLKFCTNHLDDIPNPETSKYFSTKYTEITMTKEYDAVNENIRKLLSLSLIAPRLSSYDTAAIFDFDGHISVNNTISSRLFAGGALEYKDSGLGYFNFGYDENEAHNNMGSRLFYVE